MTDQIYFHERIPVDRRPGSYCLKSAPIDLLRNPATALSRSRFLGSPMFGSAHIDPVTVKFKVYLCVALGYKETFQGCWYGGINSAVHFLQQSLKLDRTFGPEHTVEVGRDDVMQSDFILKCRANRTRCYISNLVAGALSRREQRCQTGEGSPGCCVSRRDQQLRELPYAGSKDSQ